MEFSSLFKVLSWFITKESVNPRMSTGDIVLQEVDNGFSKDLTFQCVPIIVDQFMFDVTSTKTLTSKRKKESCITKPFFYLIDRF